MVLLCFVLDLRTLPPPLFRDLKQSLLQLANFYAISTSTCERSHSKPLRDRIGLCCVLKDRFSCATETKVAYSPRGNFSLRSFHHAVNNLPADAFSPEFNHSGALCYDDIQLANILSDKVLYSWGDHDKDVGRKVIFISSRVVENLDCLTKKNLMDAGDRCVSVDFVLLEQMSSHLSDFPESVNNFVKNICDLENCSFRNYLPDAKVLCALVKQWLQELKDETEEQLQARFIFKSNLLGSLNQICCNLFTSFNHIIDEFIPCQTCRCHGFPLDDEHGKKTESSSCPVTGNDLGALDLNENSVKVGEQTILFMPSFHSMVKLQHVSSPIDFNVMERTNLVSLSEGLIVGPSYVVTASTCSESDDTDRPELNNQLLQGLCSALHSLDQGLVCSSNSNIETMRETAFQCYYILLPSDKGLMLLRRLAGSEEVVHVPDVGQLIESTAAKEIRDSVLTSLLEMEVRDYSPVLHERGFHQRLNSLVKESLQFGSLPPKMKEIPHEPISTRGDSLEAVASKQTTDAVVVEEEIPELGLKSGQDKITARITEEWEQLIVNEIPKINSPTCIPKPKLDQLVFSPPGNNRQLDEKTSRILERLELPRQLKAQLALPTITSSSAPMDVCALTKKPLIPFEPICVPNQGSISWQKPNFQRLKRKHR